MKWTSELYLKWISPKSIPAGTEWVFARKGALICRNSDGAIKAFCVFETSALNEEFSERLSLRLTKEEHLGDSFELLCSAAQKGRAEEVLSKIKSHKIQWTATKFFRISFLGSACTLRTRLKIVNVDDSPVILKLIKKVAESLGYVDVMAQVSNPRMGVAEILRLQPDVVTMDIQMPEMTGVELVGRLLEEKFFPVIMLTSLSPEDGPLIFNALNNGAFDYLQKPRLEEKEEFNIHFEERILCAAEGKKPNNILAQLNSKRSREKLSVLNFTYPPNLIWCIGASTGGTQALTQLFTSLPKKIPPTLVVLHIPAVFSKSFADTVNQLCPFTIKEAEHGEVLQDNHIYIAPGGLQMGVRAQGTKVFIDIQDAAPVNRFKPSVDYLFESITKLQHKEFVAGILTGMGRDGAKGLLELKKNGAVTFAQNEESCVVFGMPRAALEIGATDVALPLEDTAEWMLKRSVKEKKAA